MQDLVGVEAPQQAHFVAGHHVLDCGVAAIRRREVHVQRLHYLAHVSLGAAKLAVQREAFSGGQSNLPRLVTRKKPYSSRSSGPSCMTCNTRRWPGARLIRQVAAPFPRLLGRAALRPFQVRRKLLETRATAQLTAVLDAPIFQGLRRLVVGEARIDAHPDTAMGHQGPTAVGCIDFVSGLLESEGAHEPRALNG